MALDTANLSDPFRTQKWDVQVLGDRLRRQKRAPEGVNARLRT